MTLELHELRKINAEIFKELVTLHSREACSESTNNIFNHDNSMGKLGGNTAPNFQIPVNSCSSPLPRPITSFTLSPLGGSEVVTTELIITNLKDGEITHYNKMAYTVLTALEGPLRSPILSLRDRFPSFLDRLSRQANHSKV